MPNMVVLYMAVCSAIIWYDLIRTRQINCSAWLRLKLNTKMGLIHPTTLHYTPPHPTTPPGTLRPLLDQLES